MGVLLVYSVDSLSSFEGISFWIKSIEERSKNDITKILIANKIDIDKS